MPRSKARVGAHELQEVWKKDDDWTEVMPKEERKKRQNRLNQRAYRRRHQESSSTKQGQFRIERFRISEIPRPALTGGEGKKTSNFPPTEGSKHSNTLEIPEKETPLSNDTLLSIPQSMQTVPTHTLSSLAGSQLSAPLVTNLSLELDIGYLNSPNSTFAGKSDFNSQSASPDATALKVFFPYSKGIDLAPSAQLPLLNNYYYAHDLPVKCSFTSDLDGWFSPNPGDHIEFSQDTSSTLFPLSSDHLLHLIHQNVYRALMTNKSLLKATASELKVELDIILPLSQNFCDGVSVIHSKTDKALPQSLQPTIVQMNIAHSSWMNMFPFPKLRDNLIQYESDFDHGELCNDLFGDLFANTTTSYDSSPATSHSSPDTLFSSSTSTSDASISDPWEDLDDDITTRRKGLIVWGESWDRESWEITPGFLRKWPWLLKDCEDLIAHSNRWRAKRHEEPLPYPFSITSPAMASFGDFLFMDQTSVPGGLLSI